VLKKWRFLFENGQPAKKQTFSVDDQKKKKLHTKKLKKKVGTFRVAHYRAMLHLFCHSVMFNNSAK